MKKSMMNILLWVIAIIFCVNGCVMDSPKEEIGIGNDNTANKAYLSLSLNESRTVLPQALDQTKLTYKLVGRYNEEDHQLGNWRYSDMLAAHTELSVGLWDFTLTANDGTQDVLVGIINNRTITGGDNLLSFTMKECSTGTGIISVTVKMPHGKVAKVEAVLCDVSDDTLIDSQTLSVSDCTDNPTQDCALYELNSANKGLYTLLLSLYQSASDTECINEQIMLVRVEPGCLSAGTVVFEHVNTYWHITYHFEDFDVTDDPVLVTKYNESMKIILPNTYQSNYYITGNYNNEDRSGDKIRVIDYDTSGDIELWVKSKCGLLVKSTDLAALLSTLNSADEPYTIILTDSSPDISAIHSALCRTPIKVNLDMEACTELTSITADAFNFRQADECLLTSVTFPDSITSIGDCAFHHCEYLTSVTIPDNVTSIGQSAFHECSGLTSVTIGNSVTSIGEGVFHGCKQLTRVDYSGTIEQWCGIEFSGWAYQSYYNLYINGQLVTDLVIPDTVTKINDYAFHACCGLTSVTIPDSVTSIGDYAFHSCRGLTSVTIGNGVTSIGVEAFRYCSGLTNVTIGNGVTSIGNKAEFNGCIGLTTLTIEATTPPSIYNSMLSDFYALTTIYVPADSVDAYKTASGWKDYADKIVGMGSRLSNMVSVSELSSYICDLSSDKLSEIIITDNTPDLSAIKTILQTYPGKKILLNLRLCLGLTEIQSGELDDCTSLLRMYYPSSLTRLFVPNTVKQIGDYFFNNNKNLISIEISDSVTSIGKFAFSGCSSLTSVTIGNGVKSIGEREFSDCTNLTSVTIGNRVTSIGNYAFENCYRLASITIPDSVTSIGSQAFWECYGLTSVTIGNRVTSIGGDAFYGCSGLTSVTIGNRVTSIGNYAFQNCSGLMTLSVKATTPPSFGSDMLNNCSALTTIYVPTASVDAYKAASGWSGFASKIQGKEF